MDCSCPVCSGESTILGVLGDALDGCGTRRLAGGGGVGTTGVGMIYPTVHSNGTGHAGLRKQYDEAIEGLRLALEGLRETQPHGRDYYTQGDEAFTQARKEYLERDAKLRSVYDDLVHLRHVLEGVGEKR